MSSNAQFMPLAAASVPSENSNGPDQRVTASVPVLPTRVGPKYRGGFSTSICDLFSNPYRRNDCCAIALCGILSTDRSRFLLNSEMPNWILRISCHILLPLGLLFADHTIAKNLNQAKMENECRQIFEGEEPMDESELDSVRALHSILRLILVVVLLVIFIRSRIKRAAFRDEVMSRISSDSASPSDLRARGAVDGDKLAANRPFQCCYVSPDVIVSYNNPTLPQGEEGGGADVCSCIWKTLSYICCAACCGCWCQCCGMCAAGQEEREVNALVPKEEQMIDYVTFEPFAAYFPSIKHLRETNQGSFSWHYSALSRLSANLLKGAAVIFGCAFVVALVDIDSNFTMKNMLVLTATLFQAFVILYFVHWKWHRFDLSLDAVIKYFASGFFIATSLAMIIEALISFVIGFLVGVLFAVAAFFELSISDQLAKNVVDDPTAATKELLKENTWIFVFYMFLNAFVVAALTEELCKYFGFWMVEHPDLMARDEFNTIALHNQSGVSSGQGETQEDEKDDATEGETRSYSFRRGRLDNDEQRSLNSKGTGITIAMVATAMGFACCENIGYVFSSSKVQDELTVLLARSLLPVHPIAAAIQSVGVCRRDLEGDKSHMLGKIILPAVILHGSFDFILMVIPTLEAIGTVEDTDDFATDTKMECMVAQLCKQYADSDAVEERINDLHCEDIGVVGDSWMDILGVVVALAIMVFFVFYYVVQSRKQKRRLDALEGTRSVSQGGNYNTVV